MYNSFKSEIDHIDINADSKIYLAISGGVDSMVLSNLLIRAKISHTLLHCNFKLRNSESDTDEQFIRKYAEDNKLDYHINSFDTNKIAKELNLTTQECARKLRYDWFFTFLNKEDSRLMTAHHLDDSIETFFINLLRGTGLKGLTGINSGERQVYRPLLSFSKKDILDYSRENNILYREDSSNQNDHYLRNKLRHQFIPNLKSLSDNVETKISTLFTELKETELFIEHFLSDQKSNLKQTNTISLSELYLIPHFMWHRLFSEFGVNRVHNNELVKLTTSITGSVFNSPTHIILKDRESIIIKELAQPQEYLIHINKNQSNIDVQNGNLTIDLIDPKGKINFESNCAFLDADKIIWPLTLRSLQTGDKIIPFGFKGEKLISKVLKDNKLNKFQKESQYLIESGGEIIWLLDLMISNNYSITKQTTRIIKIEHIQY